MEFFYVVKATQKSGKEDAVIWFTAKSEARANLQLDVELEDAGIETGRGKDYAKPVRTDFPVYSDLSEEGAVDYTWCKRYELQDDGRTWLPKAGAESTGAVDNTAAPETTVKVETTVEIVPLENRTPAVRFAFHLTSDKYLTHISKEQQLAASEMSLDEGNSYLHCLLQAKTLTPEVAEISLNAEWKLVQAIKQVFTPDETHEVEVIAAFMADWVKADAGDRNQLVEDWRSGKFPLLKSESTSNAGVATGQDLTADDGIQIDEHDDETTRYPIVRMPFRKRLLSQLTSDEIRHHLTRDEHTEVAAMEMDTDNGYVQNLILAAENSEEVKAFDTKDLWRYTNAIRKVFSIEKRHELAAILQFTKVWVATDYLDRGILAREWAAGNRISSVQRTDSGTNADGGYVTDRGERAHHTLDSLDLEIACATLPMDFNPHEVPGSVLRRAKEVVAKKEEPWKSWSAILRNQPGVLAVNRIAIFNLIRIAPENIHLTPVAHLEFVNRTMTTTFNEATELMPISAVSERQESENPDTDAEYEAAEEHPGGSGKTDRNPNYKPDFDGLDTEIALATLSTDFNIYDIPRDAYSRAKDIVAAKDSPFKEWSSALRNVSGILDYSRAAIFALIRSAHPAYYLNPARLSGYIHANLTETDHENPTVEVLEAARHTPEVSWESQVNEQIEAEKAALAKQSQVENLGGGVFSIDGLLNQNTSPEEEKQEAETTSNVQVQNNIGNEEQADDALLSGEEVMHSDKSDAGAGEETTAVEQSAAEILAAAAPNLASKVVDDVNQNSDSVTQNGDSVNHSVPEAQQSTPETQHSEPEQTCPEYFEPGRYEGLPNEVYHAANGTSSTMVKDARVSLMFYHGRHVTKTIRRESSEALTFGSLVHTLGLEPEKLDEEYAVFPGVPADAFTTTDSLKAFIREFNADKPKAEQLKLTGKKEELQDAIRAVNPDAIFADEFEQQWRESVDGKTILNSEQLTLATAIQQALLNHKSAGKLLRHPSRAVETSYFGMDEETGLEVRVRPDLEVEISGVRIGVDLKTISMGRVKQDGLRAKLHREITDRDYHVSAAMYSNVADFDQFFWIFVNKDEGYHWVAVIEASEELLELGMLEYRKAMRAIANGFDTGEWPAPITDDYTDELNDFDLRRLEALRTQA